MKQPRLLWLVAVMGVLAILRVLAPSTGRETVPTVAEAIVRKAPPTAKRATPSSPVAVAVAAVQPQSDVLDEPGNAFAVRPPPPPPYVPPVVVAKGKAAAPAPIPVIVAAPAEPAPPPMPYQVIGTWDDGKESGVFLSSPNGTLFARPGMTLQAEYKVTAITPQQISLVHLATQREVRLAVPRPPNTPRPYP
jgi:hypothetical protein